MIYLASATFSGPSASLWVDFDCISSQAPLDRHRGNLRFHLRSGCGIQQAARLLQSCLVPFRAPDCALQHEFRDGDRHFQAQASGNTQASVRCRIQPVRQPFGLSSFQQPHRFSYGGRQTKRQPSDYNGRASCELLSKTILAADVGENDACRRAFDTWPPVQVRSESRAFQPTICAQSRPSDGGLQCSGARHLYRYAVSQWQHRNRQSEVSASWGIWRTSRNHTARRGI